MKREPIYCAEQIEVHPDLADVLKAYAKAVIQQQPHNLVEFSAKYFADLSSKGTAAHSTSQSSSGAPAAAATVSTG